MYSIRNEGKPVPIERFIRTLKAKICKCMTWISKYVYINKLHDIVNEYNNTYHRTIKMTSVHVKGNRYMDSNKEVNNKNRKLTAGDHVRISKYKILLVILKAKKLLEYFKK